MRLAFDQQTATKTRRGKAFAISVSNLSPTRVEEEMNQLNQPSVSILEAASNDDNDEQKKEETSPRVRAAGGVWLHSSDFPHSFTNVIVYHNMNRCANAQVHNDVWSEVDQPYTANEKDVYLRIDLDEDAFSAYKESNGLNPELSMEEVAQIMSAGEEQSTKGLFPGEQ